MSYAHSQVLIDMRGLARTLASVHEDFAIVEFLDVCTAIEAIVLHDQLKLVAQSPEEAALNTQILGDSLDLLAQSNALDEAFTYIPRPAPDPRLKRYGSRNFKFKLTDDQVEVQPPYMHSTLEDAYSEAALLIDAERVTNVSALSLRRYSAFYEPEARVREEHTVCDLSAQYENLSGNLRATRAATRYPISPYILAFIPPLPVLALQRAQGRSKILKAALELREEFSSLRDSLRSLREELADPETVPSVKLRALKSWAKSWATLDQYESPSVVNLGNASFEYLDIDKSVDGETIDLNLGKLLNRLLAEGQDQFYKWRIRVLHSSAQQYLSTSDSAIYKEIRRLFGHELSGRDLERLEDWERRLKQIAELSESRSVDL